MRNPLLDELRAAFPPVSLTAARAFYMYSDAELCERAFEGKAWDDVDDRLLCDRSDALAFMSRERQLTWLPAYLNHVAMADPMHSAVWSTLMSTLTAPDPDASSARKRRRFEEELGDKLTIAQRRVVARTLQLVIERHPAWGKEPRIALDRYWGAFADTPTVTQDPLLPDLRVAFPPVVIADVFVEDDWRYCELYDYQRAIEGKTWEQLDRLFLIQHADALEYFNERAVLAVLPMHLHLLRVFAPTWASSYVIAALDRVTLNAAQEDVVARYRAAFA